MNNKIKIVLSLLLQSGLVLAYAPVNMFRPYDINWRMTDWKGKDVEEAKYRLGINVESGDTFRSRNFISDKAGLLSIYQATQSSIAMLLGAPAGSAIESLANEIMPATDDGTRGHFNLDGAKYREIAYTFYVNRDFELETVPGIFQLTGYLPFRAMKISGVGVFYPE